MLHIDIIFQSNHEYNFTIVKTWHYHNMETLYYSTHYNWYNIKILTVSLLDVSTSIMPRSRFWQSGGTKCGMWNTPRFTFSSSCRKLSSSNGSAPYSDILLIQVILVNNMSCSCMFSIAVFCVYFSNISTFKHQRHSSKIHCWFMNYYNMPHRSSATRLKNPGER